MSTTRRTGRTILMAACCLVVTLYPATAEDTAPVETVDNRILFGAKLFQKGEIDEALGVITGYLSENPESVRGRELLATIKLEKGDYSGAKEMFDILVTASNRSHITLNNYAWLLATSSNHEFRDPQRAVDLAREALLLSPRNLHVWSTMAEAHYVNRDFEKAMRAIKNCMEQARIEKMSATEMAKYKAQYSKIRDADRILRLIE